jgi:hypothetical protein
MKNLDINPTKEVCLRRGSVSDERIVLGALQDAYDCARNESDRECVRLNLENARDFASPRLKRMKDSIEQHLHSLNQNYRTEPASTGDDDCEAVEHFFILFCEAVGATPTSHGTRLA